MASPRVRDVLGYGTFTSGGCFRVPSSAPGSSSRFILHFSGVYQMGDAHARSWCFIGTSGDILIPKRNAS